MNRKNSEASLDIGPFLIAGAIGLIVLCISVFAVSENENITIREYDSIEVIDRNTIQINTEDESYEVFLQSFLQNSDKITDLTVNSKMVIFLQRNNFLGEGYWVIDKIIKVPE